MEKTSIWTTTTTKTVNGVEKTSTRQSALKRDDFKTTQDWQQYNARLDALCVAVADGTIDSNRTALEALKKLMPHVPACYKNDNTVIISAHARYIMQHGAVIRRKNGKATESVVTPGKIKALVIDVLRALHTGEQLPETTAKRGKTDLIKADRERKQTEFLTDWNAAINEELDRAWNAAHVENVTRNATVEKIETSVIDEKTETTIEKK